MKTRLLTTAVFSAAAVLGATARADVFALRSTDIAAGRPLTMREVFNGFGCEGGNVSPQLSWSGAPSASKSFAVTVYDPDAPGGKGWWHWTVVNIPASIHSLPTGAGNPGGALPAGAVQGRTDFGQSRFGGACPPVGDKPHRYQFTVWALKVATLPLDKNTSGAQVAVMLNANALATARLTATYGR